MSKTHIPVYEVESMITALKFRSRDPKIMELMQEMLEERSEYRYVEVDDVKDMMMPYLLDKGEDYRRAVVSRIYKKSKPLGDLID